MKTILILDDNVGFLCWLGKILGEAGYQPVPALGIPRASAMIASLGLTIDLVILNPAAPGAAAFVQTLRRQRQGLRIIALVDGAAGADLPVEHVDGVGRKPPFFSNVQDLIAGIQNPEEAAIQLVSRSEWLALVRATTAAG